MPDLTTDDDKPTFDTARSKKFLAQMTGVINGGAMALMCSIGHKTGLFDVMAGLPPSSSADIATATGLEERYVREWLAATTAGGIIDHDSDANTFHLPAEHAGLLTRDAGSLNLTTYCQYISLLGQVEDDVVDAFHNGGGVPYDRYPQFQTLMAETSGQRLLKALISDVVPLFADGERRLTEGLDVADVGCGSGRALNVLAANYPNSRFVGFDIADQALDGARAEAAENGTSNVEFVTRDAAALDEVERFDLITSFDAVHDQAHPDKMLEGIFAALRPGGTYLCVEPKASSHLHENLENPSAPMMYTISTMHCMTVSLAYGGAGLGTAWGEQLAREMLTDVGFTEIQTTGIESDRTNHYLLSRKPDGQAEGARS